MGFVSRPKLGTLTQGTIFSCARAEGYAGCLVHGLVITARCDAAQEKVPLFNYLPLVPLKAWLERDGRDVICARAESEALSILGTALKAAGYSTSVLQTIAFVEIEKELLPAGAVDKKIVAARKAWLEGMKKLNQVRSSRAAPRLFTHSREVCEAFPHIRKALLKELVTQKLAGYYFLPAIEPDGDDGGYVVLMREIRYIPSALVPLIAAGAIKEDVEKQSVEPFESASCLDFRGGEFAYPVGQIDSPHIEHVMQVFSSLFARIGLPDVDKKLQDLLWERIIESEHPT